jgi:hypothetical protein
LDHLTSPGLAYSQILLARIYEPLVLVNTVISWIRLEPLYNMYNVHLHLQDTSKLQCVEDFLVLTIILFRSGIAFYFHLFSTVQVTVRPKKKMCVYGHMSKKSRIGWHKIFFFRLSAKPEIVVPGSGILFQYFIFEISGKPSFV